jgi:hypothetical protein
VATEEAQRRSTTFDRMPGRPGQVNGQSGASGQRIRNSLLVSPVRRSQVGMIRMVASAGSPAGTLARVGPVNVGPSTVDSRTILGVRGPMFGGLGHDGQRRGGLGLGRADGDAPQLEESGMVFVAWSMPVGAGEPAPEGLEHQRAFRQYPSPQVLPDLGP